MYNIVRCHDGLSPNGKATDSDSVTVKVRILLAQRKKPIDLYVLRGCIGFCTFYALNCYEQYILIKNVI